MKLNHGDNNWLDDVCSRIEKKIEWTSRSIGNTFPFVSVNGKYQGYNAREFTPAWWTNSFWSGILWQMYRNTDNEYYRETAESCEEQLDAAFAEYDGLHHDVGFLWSLSSIASYKIRGNEQSRRRGMLAASVLASRFHLKGNYIRAWNGDHNGWVIVDCLMNLPLLYWASEQSKDSRFRDIAMAHADTAINYVQRPDGSVNHIISFNQETGEFVKVENGQGFSPSSSWSRGQAWAVYGFALSYRYTGEVRYLDAAKRSAHYVIASICDDWIPRVDFRSPILAGNDKDSSAGAIIAAGLLEIAASVPEDEKVLYSSSAIKILKALDQEVGSWGDNEEGLLLHGTQSYHHKSTFYPNDTPIIYGDYFFVEAIMRLKGQQELFW
ncbi:MAG: glycoside hydrolase family 88 protein [Spirochaetaceae bacterium]